MSDMSLKKKGFYVLVIILLVIIGFTLYHYIFTTVNTHALSHSEIMDFPAYPDDLVPAYLRGDPALNSWIPWICGICVDDDGEPLIFRIAVQGDSSKGFGDSSCSFLIRGTTTAATFDTSKITHSDGVVTIGTMPKLTIDYHHPHTVRIDANATTYLTMQVRYRGIPLWYSKTSNPADMLKYTQNLSYGGYDAPFEVTGQAVLGATIVSFSGYGDWEHVWFIGPLTDVATSHAKWMVFNDLRYCGVVVVCRDAQTGEVISKTGRLTDMVTATSLIFDDFEWIDHGRQPIDFFHLKGPAKDLSGNVKATVDLEGNATGHFSNPNIWTQLAVIGSVGSEQFNGTCWSEVHNNAP